MINPSASFFYKKRRRCQIHPLKFASDLCARASSTACPVLISTPCFCASAAKVSFTPFQPAGLHQVMTQRKIREKWEDEILAIWKNDVSTLIHEKRKLRDYKTFFHREMEKPHGKTTWVCLCVTLVPRRRPWGTKPHL